MNALPRSRPRCLRTSKDRSVTDAHMCQGTIGQNVFNAMALCTRLGRNVQTASRMRSHGYHMYARARSGRAMYGICISASYVYVTNLSVERRLNGCHTRKDYMPLKMLFCGHQDFSTSLPPRGTQSTHAMALGPKECLGQACARGRCGGPRREAAPGTPSARAPRSLHALEGGHVA